MARCDCALCQDCVIIGVRAFLERELREWEPRIAQWKEDRKNSAALDLPRGGGRGVSCPLPLPTPGDPVPCPNRFSRSRCPGIVPLGDCQQLAPDLTTRWCEAANIIFFARSSFLRCPHPTCHMVIERIAPSKEPAGGGGGAGSAAAALCDSLREVDLSGRPLSDAALQDRAENRYRCPMCGINFCAKCLAVPYHLGQTCAERNAPRCYYCEDKLPAGWRETCEQSWKKDKKSLRRMKEAALRLQLDVGWCRSVEEHEEVLQLFSTVCDEEDCRSRLQAACTKKLPCGHRCGGVRGGSYCLPCLKDGCGGEERAAGGQVLPSADDFCAICMVEPLDKAPCLLLGCKHVVHKHCAEGKLRAGYPGPAISTKYLECPMCSREMSHSLLKTLIEEPLKLKAEITQKALKRLELERRGNAIGALEPGGEYEGRPEAYALHTYQFFMCFNCKKPYFGGERRCAAPVEEENGDDGGAENAAAGDYNLAELICGGCASMASGAEECKRGHGKEYIQFKCRYCCSIATFYCMGTTHFCDVCHSRRPDIHKGRIAPPCPGPSTCPLGIPHHPQGVECYLGCALCRYNEP
ncbi:hypothetical protein CBR_g39123 [Chara braunii]|uniref:RING-type domain-containing protein n=1 Tax=Chara braunii TaxID=69332 RepID=A0A388LR61_CHABU|nr:hypothetical protein CBR_g39123 [Chara braunii]|eukprot:GBG84745.1 hypothetical protein CBR_g39123 [Chara braunii]